MPQRAELLRVMMLSKIWRLLSRRGRPESLPESLPVGIVSAAKASAPILVSEAFTPTHPRTGRSGLIGRRREIELIIQRLLEDKAHIVLFSERGMGKTSLANGVVELLRRGGVFVARYQCEASTNFDSLMRGLARTVPGSLLAGAVRPELLEGCEAAFSAAPIRPEDVVSLLRRLRLPALVCVIDEVDRIVDLETRTMLADTIKQLSDRGIPLLFMLIGVSESLEQLLGEHPSIQRALVGVPLPLLSDEDIVAIVDRGAREAGLTFPRELAAAVARTARGMPYLAHLLGLRTAQAAARRSTSEVSQQDFVAALDQLILETPLHVVQCADELTADGQDAPMSLALDGLARCEQDRLGRIRIVQKSPEQVLVGGRPVADGAWRALLTAGVVRPCKGAAGHATVAHRGLNQYQTLRLAAEAQRFMDKPVAEERPMFRGRPAYIENEVIEVRELEARKPDATEVGAEPGSMRRSIRG